MALDETTSQIWRGAVPVILPVSLFQPSCRFLRADYTEETVCREPAPLVTVRPALSPCTRGAAVVWRWHRCSADGLRTTASDWTPQQTGGSAAGVEWRETASAVVRWVVEETARTDSGRRRRLCFLWTSSHRKAYPFGMHPFTGYPMKSISQSLLLRSCLKALTIILLLFLSKKCIFIIKCNVCYFNFILAL